MTAIVKVSKSALFEMVMAAFEAYGVKHDGKDIVAIETHAHLWGKVNKTHPFKCSIEHVSVDTSAAQDRCSVAPEPLSLEIKKDIASVFGEGYQHIGSFHTHPYLKKIEIKSSNELRKRKFYNFTDGDHQCELGNPTIEIGKKQYSVALVMTIHATDKSDDRKDGEIESNLFEFSLGNIKLWLKARVYEHKAVDDISVEDELAFNMYGLDFNKHFKVGELLPIPVETKLECNFLTDFGFYLKEFGRLDINSNDADYRSKDIAEKRWFIR
ncbi:hypothetical protein D5R81_11980 [Parashewanella spongiae]|uniref:Uncharacterized protein n=1 Tax=Parashewanella spongiae TaxID=342950 RepID=A0A3A6TX97_9GAMM|nr:hypothetical protein [Parashewanella spongiae]MCL1078622.1 hypothetical protein [Parashewanella spongiae]RJY13029.1 hypothetical protein D5R81_11980 [Parashewanella spongiae]